MFPNGDHDHHLHRFTQNGTCLPTSHLLPKTLYGKRPFDGNFGIANQPSNIMVERTATGGLRPVIMDFGLARESGDSHGLTESGAVMGTDQAFSFCRRDRLSGSARYLCWQKVGLRDPA